MTQASVMIVCGGRRYEPVQEDQAVLEALVSFFRPHTIFHGDCVGIDKCAASVLGSHPVEPQIRAFPADWEHYGDAAGPIRNKRMADEAAQGSGSAVVVVAFPGGAGTAGMVRIAQNRRFRVIDLRRLR